MQRSQITERLEANTRRILDALGAPANELARAYAPGKWTANALLAHIADVEFINLWRFMTAVAQPGSPAAAFDENRWAEAFAYEQRPIQVSRDLFAGARAQLAHYLQNLSDDALSNEAVHPEKGRLNGLRWCRLVIDHAEHHLDQVDASRSGEPWVPRTDVEDDWMFRGMPNPNRK